MKIIFNFLVGFLMLSALAVKAQTWSETQKIIASDRTALDRFGCNVSIYGSVAMVGARNESENANGEEFMGSAGSAYFFELDENGSWVESQKIVANDRVEGDLFGWSVSVHGDYAFVGSYGNSTDGDGENYLDMAGAAYIFKKDDENGWVQIQKLAANDREEYDSFGSEVSLYGNYAAISAPSNSTNVEGGNYISGTGAVYIYELDEEGGWNFVQKIVASDRNSNDCFGYAIDLYNGNLIVSAVNDSEDENGNNWIAAAGSAYIFERSSEGVWVETQKIVASDRGVEDDFGLSVSIYGNYAVVGAFSEDEDENSENFIFDSGAAYVYFRNSEGEWNQVQKLVAYDRDEQDKFGSSVSVSEEFIAIGAPREMEDSEGENPLFSAGAVYVYNRNESNQWVFNQKLVPETRIDSELFPSSVDIHENFLFAGTQGGRTDITGDNVLSGAGSANFFKVCQPNFTYISSTVCFSYTTSGGVTYTESGLYTDTITSINGCDSIINLNLTINSVDSIINMVEGVLEANANDATYLWLQCVTDSSYAEIEGEIGEIFIPENSGMYAVQVTQNGCTAISECFNVLVSAMNEYEKPEIIFYPNPTTDQLKINLINTYNNLIVKIEDVNGNIIFSEKYGSANNLLLEFNSNPGVYLVKLYNGEQLLNVERIIKI